MYSAPSVSYPVGRCRFEAMALAVLGGVALGILTLWSLAFPPGWRQVAGWLVFAGCLVLASRVWWHSVHGNLRWEGGTWSFASGATLLVGPLSVALDLQSVLLVRSSLTRRWFWLEARSAPSLWPDLRRAVYSRAIDDALQQPGGRPTAGIAP